MKHDYYTSKDIGPHDTWGQLNIVDGGLSHCKICGGLEGSLTTDCPGEMLSYEQDQKVYKGEVDFVNGQWVKQPSKNSPVYLKRERTANGH